MSRLVIAVLAIASSAAHAEPVAVPQQGIGGALGAQTGGRTTPGGLRLAGNYLYQLAERDWFDGTAAFTYGSGSAACFRDRMDDFICDHGLASGRAVLLDVGVRRYLGPPGDYLPFVRLGVGLAIVQFSDDEVTGLAVPIHAGGGLRVQVAPRVAVTAQGALAVGIARYNHGLGGEPQLGVHVTVGAELGL